MLELSHINNVLNNRAHVNNLVIEPLEIDSNFLLVLLTDRHLDDLIVTLHAVKRGTQVVGHVSHEHDVVVLLFRQLLNLALTCDVTDHKDCKVAEVLLHPFIIIFVFNQELVAFYTYDFFAVQNLVVSFKVKLEVKQLMAKRALSLAHVEHHL
mgnify:FL=1